MDKIVLTKEFLEQALKELNQSGLGVVQLFPKGLPGSDVPRARIAQNPYSSGSHSMFGYHTRIDEERDYKNVLVFLKG